MERLSKKNEDLVSSDHLPKWLIIHANVGEFLLTVYSAEKRIPSVHGYCFM